MKESHAPASVMPALGAFVAAAAARPLPPAVLEKTKQHVLKTLACMISGTTLAPGRLAIGMVATTAARRTWIPERDLVALGEIAAFTNGMTARRAVRRPDARSRIHPGASVARRRWRCPNARARAASVPPRGVRRLRRGVPHRAGSRARAAGGPGLARTRSGSCRARRSRPAW